MKQIFSFCPGIAWPIDQKKNIVIPELSLDQWQTITQDRHWVVAGFGDLLESFFALMILEVLYQYNPQKSLFYSAPQQYQFLFQAQGLSHPFPHSITPQLLRNNPLPIFCDQKYYTIFNYLHNYQSHLTVEVPVKKRRRYTPLLEQVMQNCLFPWSVNYIPKFRNLANDPLDLAKWARIYKFNYYLPFVIIFPDKKSSLSTNKYNFISWDFNKLKSFLALLKTKKIQSLIVSENVDKYKLISDHLITPKLDWLLFLLPKAKLILSEKIDWLIIAQLISNAIICQKKLNSRLDLLNPFSIARQSLFVNKSNNNQLIYHTVLDPIDIISSL